MEISVALLLLLAISAILFLQFRSPQPDPPTPPQSPDPLTPLTGSSGKKGRKERRKKKGLNGKEKAVAVHEKHGAKLPPFPFFWLSGALKRRITEGYIEGMFYSGHVSFDQVDIIFF
jgi:hypothetical protein